MSLILDALRQGARTRTTPAPEAAHADAVLATLGYGTATRTAGGPSRPLVLLGVVALGSITIWWGWLASIPPGSSVPGIARGIPTVPSKVVRSATGDEQPQALPAVNASRATTSAAASGIDIARTSTSARVNPAASDFRLALYYQRAGDFARALSHYRAVLARYELNPEAHNNLGLLYQQRGLLDEAVREFRRATIINPQYARAHSNLGVALMRQGQLDLARAALELACSLDARDAAARVNLAIVQQSSHEADTAKAGLLNALAIDPSSAAAHYNLALLYDNAGETSRALEHYRAFLDNVSAEHAALARDVSARVALLTRGTSSTPNR